MLKFFCFSLCRINDIPKDGGFLDDVVCVFIMQMVVLVIHL